MSNDEWRNDVRGVTREAVWTLPRLAGVVFLFVIVFGVGFFALRSLGLIGSVAVERAVFEQSYQRDAAQRARIATDEATLAEIQRKLSNTNLDQDTRNALEAQAAAARIRIATAKGE